MSLVFLAELLIVLGLQGFRVLDLRCQLFLLISFTLIDETAIDQKIVKVIATDLVVIGLLHFEFLAFIFRRALVLHVGSLLRFGRNFFVLALNLDLFVSFFDVDAWIIVFFFVFLKIVRQLLLPVFNSSSIPIFAHVRLGVELSGETAVVMVINKVTAIVSISFHKRVHPESLVGDQVHRIFLCIELNKRRNLFELVQSYLLWNVTFGISFLEFVSAHLTVKIERNILLLKSAAGVFEGFVDIKRRLVVFELHGLFPIQLLLLKFFAERIILVKE